MEFFVRVRMAPDIRINLKTAVKRCQPFDTPATRATQGERPLTKLVTTPFVLITNHLATVLWLLSGMASRSISALRSKAYRSMSGVALRFLGSTFNLPRGIKLGPLQGAVLPRAFA